MMYCVHRLMRGWAILRCRSTSFHHPRPRPPIFAPPRESSRGSLPVPAPSLADQRFAHERRPPTSAPEGYMVLWPLWRTVQFRNDGLTARGDPDTAREGRQLDHVYLASSIP